MPNNDDARSSGSCLERQLKRFKETVPVILGALSSVLVCLDGDDRVQLWNNSAERCFGLGFADVDNKPFFSLSLGLDKGVLEKSFEKCRQSLEPDRIEQIPFTSPEGQGKVMGLTVHPVPGHDDSPGILLLGKDITEIKARESRFSQEQKMQSIGRLAAGIAHEINTPTQYVGDNTHFLKDAFEDMTGLLSSYGKLAEAVRDSGEHLELLEKIDRVRDEADLDYLLEEIPQAISQSLEGIERVTEIVLSMKQFSHPGAEDKALMDVNKAVASAVTVSRNEWKYVSSLETELTPDMPLVPAIQGEINQVLLNIILNAAQSIADGGSGREGKGLIRVSTSLDGEHAVISISDNGPGIPEDIRPRVFDPFFTTKEVGQGTGQGLALAYASIVDRHGGRLEFDSKPGAGTTFHVRLPLANDQE